jgi:hypothetical protein
MSDARPDPQTIVAAWLADGPSVMPDGLRRQIADDSRASPQQSAGALSSRSVVRALRPLPITGRLVVVLVLLGIMLALVIGTALLGGSIPDQLRAIVPPEPSEDPYQAVLARVDDTPEGAVEGIDVVAVRADGRERSIGRIDGSRLPTWARDFVNGPVVSSDGWLAFRATGPSGHGWAFVDLRAPDAPIRVVTIPWWGGFPSRASGAWGPDGRFAGSASEYHDTYDAIDRATGAVVEIPGLPADVDGQPVALDPSRIRALTDGGVAGDAWLMADPQRPGLLALYQSTGPRRIIGDGTVLDVCDVGPGCVVPDLHDGAVTIQGQNGTPIAVDVSRLLPDRVVDASYARDGASIWLILQRGAEAAYPVLGRLGADGSATTFGAYGPFGAPTGPAEDCCTIAGIAPDDSLIALDVPGLPGPIIWPTEAEALLSPAHTGTFAGFLPASVADALPGGGWMDPPSTMPDVPQPDLSPPQPGGPAPAPTASAATVEMPSGFQLVHTELHEGTGQPGGDHVAYSIGPFDSGHGLAFVLTCVGASEARLTTDVPGDEAWTNRCLGGTIGGERSVPVTGGPVMATVTADPATTWQLTVYAGSPNP